MSDIVYCAFCGKELDLATIIKERHLSSAQLQKQKTFTCNRIHENAYRQQSGAFKNMSLAGREARSEAVTKSNSVNPRRKKQS